MDNQQADVVFLKCFGINYGIYANGDVYNFYWQSKDPVKTNFHIRPDGYAAYRYIKKNLLSS
jgi:hypothetical protein